MSPTVLSVQTEMNNFSLFPTHPHYHPVFFSLDNTWNLLQSFQVSKLRKCVLHNRFKKQLGTWLLIKLYFLMESWFLPFSAHTFYLCSCVHMVRINENIEKAILMKAKEWGWSIRFCCHKVLRSSNCVTTYTMQLWVFEMFSFEEWTFMANTEIEILSFAYCG